MVPLREGCGTLKLERGGDGQAEAFRHGRYRSAVRFLAVCRYEGMSESGQCCARSGAYYNPDYFWHTDGIYPGNDRVRG